MNQCLTYHPRVNIDGIGKPKGNIIPRTPDSLIKRNRIEIVTIQDELAKNSKLEEGKLLCQEQLRFALNRSMGDRDKTVDAL